MGCSEGRLNLVKPPLTRAPMILKFSELFRHTSRRPSRFSIGACEYKAQRSTKSHFSTSSKGKQIFVAAESIFAVDCRSIPGRKEAAGTYKCLETRSTFHRLYDQQSVHSRLSVAIDGLMHRSRISGLSTEVRMKCQRLKFRAFYFVHFLFYFGQISDKASRKK